jgi:shikimate kinase
VTETPEKPSDLVPAKTIALVGLMGAGKTSVGRRLAAALGLPFRDADGEIEAAAGRTVAEIFAERGEAEFRAGERRVIARLLEEPPHVLATGGGAFVEAQTRRLINARAVSIWLRADPEILARRVARKATRPLLIGKDPLAVLKAQVHERYPAYAEAHHVVDAGEGPHGATVQAILALLAERRDVRERAASDVAGAVRP